MWLYQCFGSDLAKVNTVKLRGAMVPKGLGYTFSYRFILGG